MNSNNENIDIELGEYTGLRRVYDYLPYTFHRIKRVLKENDMRLDNIYQGYKANRRPGYCELYRIVRISDCKIIRECISLEQIRRIFARMDIPLEDEKSMSGLTHDKYDGNSQARRFLEIVTRLNSDGNI